MKEKRKYVKPVQQVFELREMPRLLAGSGDRSPYQPVSW